MKTYYAVTFTHGSQRMFAYRGVKPRGMYPPENRCIFKTRREAEKLMKWLKVESTFPNLKIEQRDIKD